MTVTWQVEDGYAGKSRPQSTYIPDEEVEGCETKEEVDQLIEEFVSWDFQEKISYSITGIQ